CHAALHEVEQEEPGAAAQFEGAAVRPAALTGDQAEPPGGVVDAALVVGDRPLLVVRAGLPVVIEHVGQLGIVAGGFDLLGGGVWVRGGVGDRLGGHQRPTNFALPGPFAMNDSMPMVRYWVANRAANTSLSRFNPERRSPSRPPSIARFAAASAGAGP